MVEHSYFAALITLYKFAVLHLNSDTVVSELHSAKDVW